MTIANVEEVGVFSTANGFLNSNLNPLTLNGLKKFFEVPEKAFKKFLKENDYEDDVNAVFYYLNNEGYTDDEVIRDILTKEKKKYFVEFIEDRHDGYFKIYEVEK